MTAHLHTDDNNHDLQTSADQPVSAVAGSLSDPHLAQFTFDFSRPSRDHHDNQPPPRSVYTAGEGPSDENGPIGIAVSDDSPPPPTQPPTGHGSHHKVKVVGGQVGDWPGSRDKAKSTMPSPRPDTRRVHFAPSPPRSPPQGSTSIYSRRWRHQVWAGDKVGSGGDGRGGLKQTTRASRREGSMRENDGKVAEDGNEGAEQEGCKKPRGRLRRLFDMDQLPRETDDSPIGFLPEEALRHDAWRMERALGLR